MYAFHIMYIEKAFTIVLIVKSIIIVFKLVRQIKRIQNSLYAFFLASNKNNYFYAIFYYIRRKIRGIEAHFRALKEISRDPIISFSFAGISIYHRIKA